VEHRLIGGLSVSVVGMGCNQLGTTCDERMSAQIVGEALDAGVSYFDTADEYGRNYLDPTDERGWGVSEEYLGRALKGRRDDAVIASKFGVRPPGSSDRGGAGAGWIEIAVEDSLRRLGTDRIDLYQLHIPDPTVPIGETLGALDRLVHAGKVREVGCCNLSGEELDHAASVADELGVGPFVSVQSPLNVIQRAGLADVMPSCERLGMAFIPYYPLASGMLTGKYRRGERPSSGTRLTDQLPTEVRDRLFSDRTFDRLEALEGFAASHGHTLLELAFAWLLGHPNVATVIAGAAKPGQVSANARAAGWQLEPGQLVEIVEVVQKATA
jgi:aryl-alcohol dehydrogenase-like predicted oxidoreductase